MKQPKIRNQRIQTEITRLVDSGVRQSEIARIAAVTPAAVYAWQGGIAAPSIEASRRIIEHFHLAPDALDVVHDARYVPRSLVDVDSSRTLRAMAIERDAPTQPVPARASSAASVQPSSSRRDDVTWIMTEVGSMTDDQVRHVRQMIETCIRFASS